MEHIIVVLTIRLLPHTLAGQRHFPIHLSALQQPDHILGADEREAPQRPS